MRPINKAGVRQYRVWIVRYRGRPPRGPGETPARCRALEPAEEQAMSAREATQYTAAFNGALLAGRREKRGPRKLWAVAVPVKLRYDGDLHPGQGLTQSPQCSRYVR
jgi:hypothetical protein